MKKQVLLLLFVIVAFVVGMNSASAQSYKNTNPAVWVAPTCGGSEFYPTIGTPYHYIVDLIEGNGYDGVGGTYNWRVTQTTDLLAGASAPAADFTMTGGTTSDATITWNPSSVGKIYYVVVEYTEQVSSPTASGTCEINNVKVYAVAPTNGFWLDINASTDGSVAGEPAVLATQGTGFEICAPDVSLAQIVTPAVPGDVTVARVKYEYGVTTMYVVIHAAGYQGSFTGTLKLSGLEENQTATIATAGVTWTAGGVDTYGNGPYTATLTSTTNGTDIPVTITITHNQHENITDQTIRVSIDGTYTDGPNTFNDLSNENGNCTPEDIDADWVDQTITPRPNVQPSSPTPFVTPSVGLFD